MPYRMTDCSIRAPPALRVSATPRGISPLDRALHRPCTPRHPPHAHPCARPAHAAEVSCLGRTLRRKEATASLRTQSRFTRTHQRYHMVRTFHESLSSAFLCQGAWSTLQEGHRPGGATGARTPNLRRARAALSRLSYDPRPQARRTPALPRVRRTGADVGWARLDSNQGPRPYQGRALTN